MFSNIKSDIKKTGNLINNILQSNDKRIIVEIETPIFNNQTFNTDSSVVNIFNEHLSSVVKNIDESIQIYHNIASNPRKLLNSSILN